MTEEQKLTAEELNAELAQLREQVEQAMAEFVAVYDGAEAEFRPLAHELRLLGGKPKDMAPLFVQRVVKNWKRRDTMDPVK